MVKFTTPAALPPATILGIPGAGDCVGSRAGPEVLVEVNILLLLPGFESRIDQPAA
jgi:hypothetical protein